MKQIVNVVLLTCAGISLAAAAGPPGEKWKITSSVQMSGMSMPGQTTELCKQPGEDTVPVKTEANCEVYDVSRSGNVQSFKMRCTGKDAMEGSSQFTYLGKDRYKGRMQVKADGETMDMVYEGQNLGACDGAETNLKAKEIQAQANEAIATQGKLQVEQCHKSAAEASSPSYMKTMCKDPEDRKTFCAAVQTHDKFRPLAMADKHSGGRDSPLAEAADLCGFTAPKVQAKLCGTAEAQGKIDFLANLCPAEADALAKAQCAGRKYTAISDKYRGFCSSYANANPSDEATDNSPAGKTKGLFNKGKKALGGLLPN